MINGVDWTPRWGGDCQTHTIAELMGTRPFQMFAVFARDCSAFDVHVLFFKGPKKGSVLPGMCVQFSWQRETITQVYCT